MFKMLCLCRKARLGSPLLYNQKHFACQYNRLLYYMTESCNLIYIIKNESILKVFQEILKETYNYIENLKSLQINRYITFLFRS